MRYALLVGTALLSFHATRAAAESFHTYQAPSLRSWLESTFTDLGKNCLRDKFRVRTSGSAIPSDVLEWGVLRSNLNQQPIIYPNASVSAIFAETYDRENGNTTALGRPLPVTWPVLVEPIINDTRSNAERTENCSTLLALNGDLKVDLAVLRNALVASNSDTTTLTSYFYAGTMLSPYAWALGDFAKPDPPGLSKLSLLLGIWSWYANNKDLAARRDIFVRKEITGVAFYSVSGLTQQGLLSEDANARFSYAFLSGGAEAKASSRDLVKGQINSYSTAIFTGNPTKYLPGAAEIAAEAEKLGQLQAVPENPKSTDGTPFHNAATLADVPEAFCSAAFWNATGPATNLVATPTPAGACRFDALLSPGAAQNATYPVNFGVAWTITPPPPAHPITLAFSAPESNLQDERAQISLAAIPVPSLKLPAVASNDPIQIVISYNVVEQPGAIVTAVRTSPTLTAECDGGKVTPLNYGSGTLQRNSNGDGTISMTMSAPTVAFAPVDSTAVKRCRINGQLRIQRTIGARSGEQQVTVPTLEFDAVRPSAPVAAPAPTPTGSPRSG